SRLTDTAAFTSGTSQAFCGNVTSNFTGSVPTLLISPTLRSVNACLRNSGEIRKPMIGIPSARVTIAPATCVPRTANCRRLSRRRSGSAIPEEAVQNADRPAHEKEQHHHDRSADQPEGQGRRLVRVSEPPDQSGDRDPHQDAREPEHDDADQCQVKKRL